MTAIAVAGQVLSWAAQPRGVPPAGPLWDPARLASPPASVSHAAAQLARRTAGLLGARSPPFGSREQIGLGVVFLAAAVGGRRQARAAALLVQAVPPGRSPDAWYDLVARHGLARAAVPALLEAGTAVPPAAQPVPAPPDASEPGGAPAPEADPDDTPPLPELLLEASPLTAVLLRPPLRAPAPGGAEPAAGSTSFAVAAAGQAVTTAVTLLSRPRGPEVLATALAAWSPSSQVLAWRADLLSRLRLDHPGLLLDVYFLARSRFAAEWDRRVAWAERQIAARGAPDPLAIATLRFWAPLAALERAASGPLSGLRPLLAGQDKAVDLVRKFSLDQTGAA